MYIFLSLYTISFYHNVIIGYALNNSYHLISPFVVSFYKYFICAYEECLLKVQEMG